MNTSTPVIVLSPHHHGALGIFRSLGVLGVPVYAVEDGRFSPPLRSRYCRDVFPWNVRTAAPQASIASLFKISENFSTRPILIPTDDGTAALVQEAAEQLQEAYRFPILPRGLVYRLSNKRELFSVCREYGHPTPETVFPQSRSEVLQFLEKAVFPLVLKSIEDRVALGQTKVAMHIAQSADELLRYYDTLESRQRQNVMLQEYIPGGDDTVWMFNGYFNNESDCLFAITGKKIRQYPISRGSTSLGICLKNETVERSTIEFMKKIGYKGILDIGYRYDARDGAYKVLDINPRIGSSFRLFVSTNGMDVARALYLDFTGQPVVPGKLHEGRKWFVEDQDLASCVAYYRSSRLTAGEWLRSFRGVEEAAYFALDDLWPCVMRTWELFGLALGNMFHRPTEKPVRKSDQLSRQPNKLRKQT